MPYVPHVRDNAARGSTVAGAIRLLLAVTTVTLMGCASPPERVDREAMRLGFTRTVVSGNPFSHVIYRNSATDDHRILHVYLEGDGLPWFEKHAVSVDPTPRRPLMLRLMALDPEPSLYLGRPCYHGFAAVPPCTSRYWTTERYSERVVTSMATVLTDVLTASGFEQVALFGYSGGGVLAMLLAERLPQAVAVITLAGNLDIDAWTALHGFSPLSGSLNPARRPPLRPDIAQLHLAGAEDQEVPSSLIATVAVRQTHANLLVLKGYDHTCCWQDIWPAVLKALEHGMDWSIVSQRAETARQ